MTATAAGRRIASIQLIIEKLLEYSRKHLFEKKYREAKEALYVRLLQIYSTACTLHPDGTYTTLYDRAGEMLRVCEELRRQESLGRWYSEEILNRMNCIMTGSNEWKDEGDGEGAEQLHFMLY